MAGPDISYWPDPAGIFHAFVAIFGSAALTDHLIPSTVRVAISLGLSAVLGLPLGYLSSRRGIGGQSVGYAVSAIRYVPPTAFIGMIILLFGIGQNAALALIVIGIAPYIAIMSADAFRAVPRDYLHVAFVYGATPWERFTKVHWPFVRPRFFEAVRVNVGAAWTLLVISEIIAGNSGIGYLISRAQRYLDIDMLYALIVISGLLGVIFDRLLLMLVRTSVWWRPDAAH
jgi:NitT/TauT family transport system permease protein